MAKRQDQQQQILNFKDVFKQEHHEEDEEDYLQEEEEEVPVQAQPVKVIFWREKLK